MRKILFLKHQLKRFLITLGLWGVLKHFYRKLFYKQREKVISELMRFYAPFIKKGDLCFDVGANRGEYCEPLFRLGAKVIAVEPQEDCVNFLENKYKDNPNFVIINKGLADREGRFEYQVLQDMPLGSPIPYLLVEDGSQAETKKYSEYLFSLGYALVGRQRNNNFFKIQN